MIAACKNMAGTQKMATDCLTSDFSTTNLNGDDLKERRGRNLLHTLDWLQKLYRLLREWKVYICLEQTKHGRKIYWELLIQLKPSVIREIPEVQTAGGAESLRKFHCVFLYPFWLVCFWPLERSYWGMGRGTAPGYPFGVRESNSHTLYTHPSWGKM